MNALEIVAILKGAWRVAQTAKGVIGDVKQVEEILFGGMLSPGEQKRVVERLTKSAEEMAKAHQQLADAATTAAGGIENIGLFFSVATIWLREGMALLNRILDLAESRGTDVSEIRRIRNLLPPPSDLP